VLLARAAGLGALDTTPPGDAAVVVDIDATLVETYGLDKSGARQVMRTGRRGYHPLLAVMAGTGTCCTPGCAGAAPIYLRGRSPRGCGCPPTTPSCDHVASAAFRRDRRAGAAALGPVLREQTFWVITRGVKCSD